MIYYSSFIEEEIEAQRVYLFFHNKALLIHLRERERAGGGAEGERIHK